MLERSLPSRVTVWYSCGAMRLGSCVDCGETITEEVASRYEPTCPSCGRLYPLQTAEAGARELRKDKKAKPVGLVYGVFILIFKLIQKVKVSKAVENNTFFWKSKQNRISIFVIMIDAFK